MAKNIDVKVRDKIASVIGAPEIICGNSDYTVTFDFDAEWATMTVKTARFVYNRDGVFQFIDVTFSGRIVNVPVLSNIDEVYLGVYTGELRTSTPTRIICKKSILCGTSRPYDGPSEDIYEQLLDTINKLELLPTVSPADFGKALMVREDGHWVVMVPDFVHNQKDGKPFKVFFGTFDEWEAWEGDKADVFFIPTDDNTLEELKQAVFEEVLEAVKAKLENAEIIADNATKVNGLEIIRDENGVLKIGDTVIPQKKLIASGLEVKKDNKIVLCTVADNASLLKKVYELHTPLGRVTLEYGVEVMINSPGFGACSFMLDGIGNEAEIYCVDIDCALDSIRIFKAYEIIE